MGTISPLQNYPLPCFKEGEFEDEVPGNFPFRPKNPERELWWSTLRLSVNDSPTVRGYGLRLDGKGDQKR
ncbi:MAG: hypothetical protein Q4D38_13620 [Planctomycetia bacterium]|nr:hypothetical protein [Planctomycetia bacterium]